MRLLHSLGILNALADQDSDRVDAARSHIVLNHIFDGTPEWPDDTSSKPHAISTHGFSFLERFHRVHHHRHMRGTVIQAGEDSFRESFRPSKLHFNEPMRNFLNHEYMGSINVGIDGKQSMKVVFDSGSTNIWLNSVRCRSSSCRRRIQFDPDKSASFFTEEIRVERHFGTATLYGVQAQETFHIGPYTIPDQGFALITREEGDVFSEMPIEGIIGMSFAGLSGFAPEGVIDRILETNQLESNMFSFYLAKRGAGSSAVMFGKPNRALYEDPMHCFPVLKYSPELKYWLVAVESLHLTFPETKHEESILFDGPSMVLFDSGTNLYSVDPEYFHDLMGHFIKCRLSEYEDKFVHMPHLHFKMKTTEGKTISVDIPPNEYMSVGAEIKPDSTVLPGWMSVECAPPDGPSYIFGQLFMHYWLTVFDRSTPTPQVCIARSIHSAETEKLLGLETQANAFAHEKEDLPPKTIDDLREFKAVHSLPEVGFSAEEVKKDVEENS